MARFRSKPVETVYVEALYNEQNHEYVVQQTDRSGKVIKGKPIDFLKEEDFHKRYEPVVRKPRGAVSVTPEELEKVKWTSTSGTNPSFANRAQARSAAPEELEKVLKPIKAVK